MEILRADNRELRCLAAEIIANVAHLRKARRIVRMNGGLRHLVAMLEDPGRPGSPITGQRNDLEVARSAALGLWSCSKSKKNKQVCELNATFVLLITAGAGHGRPCSRPMLSTYWDGCCRITLRMS